MEVGLGVFLMTWLAWVAPACLGWLFVVVLGSIGLGSVLLTRFGTQPAGFSGQTTQGGPPPSPGSPGSGAPYRSPVPSEAQDASVAGRVGAGSQAAEDSPGKASARARGVLEGCGVTRFAPARAPDPGPTAWARQWPTINARSAAAAAGDASGNAPGLAVKEVAEPTGLSDLAAIKGVTSELAERLRAAGSTTLVAIATSDSRTLGSQTGVPRDRIEQEDWIGQARRLLG